MKAQNQMLHERISNIYMLIIFNSTNQVFKKRWLVGFNVNRFPILSNEAQN